MADLRGRTVVVLEARRPSELSGLIARHGGEALNAPALREVPLPSEKEVSELVEAVCRGRVTIMVFQTGVGAQALLDGAEQLGRKDDLLNAFHGIKIVCRGPKPVAVMRANGVPITLTAPEPFTSEDLVASLHAQGWDMKDKVVAIQQYGETNVYLRNEVTKMGAQVMEVSLYEWALPEDIAPLENAVRVVAEHQVDAIAFTTQSQVRHLFEISDQLGLTKSLREALDTGVVVASVGPVCTRALAEKGVTPHVVPVHPKMGPMVLALADYFESHNTSSRNSAGPSSREG